jgi:hypothetical protein
MQKVCLRGLTAIIPSLPESGEQGVFPSCVILCYEHNIHSIKLKKGGKAERGRKGLFATPIVPMYSLSRSLAPYDYRHIRLEIGDFVPLLARYLACVTIFPHVFSFDVHESTWNIAYLTVCPPLIHSPILSLSALASALAVE